MSPSITSIKFWKFTWLNFCYLTTVMIILGKNNKDNLIHLFWGIPILSALQVCDLNSIHHIIYITYEEEEKSQALPKVTQQTNVKVIFKHSMDNLLLLTSPLLNKHFSSWFTWFWRWYCVVVKSMGFEGLPWWSSGWLCAFKAGGENFIPGQETKIPHAVWYSPKKKQGLWSQAWVGMLVYLLTSHVTSDKLVNFSEP